MNTKELRKLVRETDIDKLEDLFYELKEKDIIILVRRWGLYIHIDDMTVFDDGMIRCVECPAWSISFRSKKEFSYNIKLRDEEDVHLSPTKNKEERVVA